MNLNEERIDKLGRYINSALKNAGYKKIGFGIDSSVWMKDQGTVLKVIMPDLDPDLSIHKMKTFYKFCKEHPELENLPKFKKVDGKEFYNFKLGNVPFMQFTLEQLYPLKKKSFEEWVVWYMSGEVDKDWKTAYHNLTNTRLRDWKEFRRMFKNLDPNELANYRQFFETFRMLYKICKKNKFGWDAHTENVMKRSDGTLVITDPWA